MTSARRHQLTVVLGDGLYGRLMARLDFVQTTRLDTVWTARLDAVWTARLGCWRLALSPLNMHPKVLGMHMITGQRPMTRLASTSWLGKGPTVVAEGKGKAKVAIKGKCFHCNVDKHWKRNCPKYLNAWILDSKATNHVCSSLQETSSFKQLEESEMTLKVGMGDVI
ncbi:gag/pol protein [Cucumis melo var. makuwa]|uniref:Gag/pol protein n=1 Tax=Cucumis melo var. makuwa TaxID=1194695 RepID=A0A5A7VM74_CUCMM|nr:gag/pol protein [Cucumis melo var. makuwa]